MMEKSCFLDEIAAAPEALRALIAFYRSEHGRAHLRCWRERALAARRLRVLGMGTSEFVLESAFPAMAAAGVAATGRDAGEELYYPTGSAPLQLLVSQSGESIETCALAARAKERDSLVAVVNYPDSTLARRAGLVLELHAGEESAISTKTYSNSLALGWLLGEALRGDAALRAALDALEPFGDGIFASTSEIEKAGKVIAAGRAVQFVSRGAALTAAKQAALTFMEGTRMVASALTGGAFRHGPLELAGPEHTAVFFIPRGRTAELLTRVALEAAGHGSRIVVITDVAAEYPAAVTVLRLPEVPEELFALAASGTQALLLFQVAAQRGVTAGVFRYGSKITGRE